MWLNLNTVNSYCVWMEEFSVENVNSSVQLIHRITDI